MGTGFWLSMKQLQLSLAIRVKLTDGIKQIIPQLLLKHGKATRLYLKKKIKKDKKKKKR